MSENKLDKKINIVKGIIVIMAIISTYTSAMGFIPLWE